MNKSNRTSKEDMGLISSIASKYIGSVCRVPVSFRANGVCIDDMSFCLKRLSGMTDSRIKRHVYEGFERETGLTVQIEATEYYDFPVVEWIAYVTNNGSENSPIISDLRACTCSFEMTAPTLLHSNGDSYARAGNETYEKTLDCGKKYSFAPVGGRSCDGAYPFFRVLADGMGMNIALGWPGEWRAEYTGEENGFSLMMKQDYTNFYLKPGETVATPRVTLMTFEGGLTRGINVWRRWYLAHILPRVDGKTLEPKTVMVNPGDGEEFTLSTEEGQLTAIDTYIKRGLKPDIWWIDAGWYPCKDDKGVKRWPLTGTWEYDREKYPNGFAPVGEKCEENDIKLLVWFEVERCIEKYWGEGYDKNFLLKRNDRPEESNRLLDLANDECREWITDHIDKIIKESKIKIYRQDFNFEPLMYWLTNEDDDRRGMKENRHIRGYLQYWDDLRERNPDIFIDSCASGGRRNDLETMRRSVPLHPTDYGYGEHPVKQAFYTHWHMWTPYFRGICSSWDDENGDYHAGSIFDIDATDNYAIHCGMAPVTTFNIPYDADDEAMAYGIKMQDIWRRCAEYMLCADMYLFTPCRKSSEDYYCIQFHDEDKNEGCLHCIRNTHCEQDTLTVFPNCVDEGKTYIFESPEFGKCLEIGGKVLLERGFTIKIPRRSGEVWFYHEKI